MHNALSPLDGRYENKLNPLRKYFSEEALMRYRVLVEIRFLQMLSAEKEVSSCRTLTAEENALLEEIIESFSAEDAKKIKEIEQTTNHDVKAIEYFLKEKISHSSLADVSEWIHFSLTSEDVNNLSYALILKDAVHMVLLPELKKTAHELETRAKQWKGTPLLSRTHGQPASPTTMGKEFAIFSARLKRQITHLEQQEFLGKLAGASGNFNAHVIAFPKADWLRISQQFVESLGLTWNPVVPQIEPHDFIAEISHIFSRIATITIDCARDIWGYISLGFFIQKTVAGEVGSSAMPHKVNPIDFENAEGNMGISHALFTHFAEKLPISRWQRDLSDSTVLRNMGIAFGHHFLALLNFQKGLGKLEINEKALADDLHRHPEVLAEAVQTVMRAAGIPNPYETLKKMTRGKTMTMEDFLVFIETLDISEEQKSALRHLTPLSYTGIAEEIAEKFA